MGARTANSTQATIRGVKLAHLQGRGGGTIVLHIARLAVVVELSLARPHLRLREEKVASH